jgi:iron complex outermembrane receptor protein
MPPRQPHAQAFSSDLSNYVLGGAPNYLTQYFPILNTRYVSAAAFGDVTVPVTSFFRLRGGLRYTLETKDALGEIIQSAAGLGQLGPIQSDPSREIGRHLTWSAGFDWDIAPRNLFYATASTGYKSGGLNNLPASSGLSTYQPEKITAFEVGLKNRFFDNRLQLNLAAFHYAYNGYQTFEFYIPNTGPFAHDTFFPTVNSQTATFEGGEIQGIWKVTANDRITFGYNYLHDRFGQFIITLPTVSTQDLSGTKVPLTPASTITLGLNHRFDLPGGFSLEIGGTTQLVSSYLATGSYANASPSGTGYYTQAAYRKTNLTATLASGDGWTLVGFARNIENRATINTVAGGYPVFPNIGQVNAMVDAPRTYGFTLRKDF